MASIDVVVSVRVQLFCLSRRSAEGFTVPGRDGTIDGELYSKLVCCGVWYDQQPTGVRRLACLLLVVVWCIGLQQSCDSAGGGELCISTSLGDDEEHQAYSLSPSLGSLA